MADCLTFIEFLGLPGSGKSYYSHKVADALRANGLKISEPSWKLDHTEQRFIRAIKKILIAFVYAVFYPQRAFRINKLILDCLVCKDSAESFRRNLLYKAWYLTKKNSSILFFDEGIAQMAVSLSVNSKKSAAVIYAALIDILQLQKTGICIRIDCSIRDALLNMDARSSRDSRVERYLDLHSKEVFLERFSQGCTSIVYTEQLAVSFCFDTDALVAEIIKYLNTKI